MPDYSSKCISSWIGSVRINGTPISHRKQADSCTEISEMVNDSDWHCDPMGNSFTTLDGVSINYWGTGSVPMQLGIPKDSELDKESVSDIVCDIFDPKKSKAIEIGDDTYCSLWHYKNISYALLRFVDLKNVGTLRMVGEQLLTESDILTPDCLISGTNFIITKWIDGQTPTSMRMLTETFTDINNALKRFPRGRGLRGLKLDTARANYRLDRNNKIIAIDPLWNFRRNVVCF